MIKFGMIRSLIAFVLIAALAVIAVPPERSFACSCVGFTTLEAKERADAVFRGTVTQIDKPSFMVNSGSLAQVYLQVEEVWKGPEQQEFMVSAAISEASCGVEFKEGVSYLVFAQNQEGTWRTSICNETKEVSMSGAALKELGPGQKELTQTELEKQAGMKKGTVSEVDLYTPLWAALGITALAGAALWGFGRSRR